VIKPKDLLVQTVPIASITYAQNVFEITTRHAHAEQHGLYIVQAN